MRDDKGYGRNQTTLQIKEITYDLFVTTETEHKDQIGSDGG
ncbi:hypothetical protein [Marinoscillum luteum]|uniref:Uncharacterized protein n=1 Tax=Marinoscillum luteum TaxID=861051 RepID=A0ABW7N8E7_9BACT